MRGVLPAPPSPEEEQALLERMARGDAAARAELIERNLLLVKLVVRRLASTGIEYDERFSLGCMGLIYAVDHHDAARAKLSTYIGRCAEGMILRELRHRRTKKRTGVVVSLDAPVASMRDSGRFGAEHTLGEVLPADGPQPIEQIETGEALRAMHAAVATLPEELQRYLEIRFGGDQKVPQVEAGKVFGWSQMTTSRRERAALEACRAAMADEGLYERAL